MKRYRESAHERALEKQRDRKSRPTNADEIIRAVIEYRAACDACQPAWTAFARLFASMPETSERREARMEYMRVQQRIADARKWLLEAALAGRSEVPK